MTKKLGWLAMILTSTWLIITATTTGQEPRKTTPADGHDIHVVAPHVVEAKSWGRITITAREFQTKSWSA